MTKTAFQGERKILITFDDCPCVKPVNLSFRSGSDFRLEEVGMVTPKSRYPSSKQMVGQGPLVTNRWRKVNRGDSLEFLEGSRTDWGDVRGGSFYERLPNS